MRKLKMSELNRLSVHEFKAAPKLPVVVVLDNIRSQNNIGSIFRTADAFRCQAIYLCGITATPPHREIQKTALGATESVTWKYYPHTLQTIEDLKSANYKIYAVEQTDKSLPIDNFYPGSASGIAVIFGNEVSGIDDQVLLHVDGCIEIPQSGTKHSLNISVAAGIVLWHLYLNGKNLFIK
jgi:23S rRNA (guanosine2251-2'-O)-methyltransferase